MKDSLLGAAQTNWFEANQNYLMAEVNQIRQLLEEKVLQTTAESEFETLPSSSKKWRTDEQNLESSSVLATLYQRFNLSSFERQILLLCVGAELSQAFGPLCAAFHGNAQHAYPTFGMALSLFSKESWAALTPDAPLRRWRLIEVMAGAELTQCPLRIDEHILHTLMGIQCLDSRLREIVNVLSVPLVDKLPESHQKIVDQIADGLAQYSEAPVVQLWGGDGAAKRAIATAVATKNDLSIHIIDVDVLPTDQKHVNLLQSLWERESILAQSVLLLNCDYLPTTRQDAQRVMIATRLIESCQRPLIVTSCERLPQRQRSLFSIEVQAPTIQEQRQLWQTHLGEIAYQLNGQVDQLVAHFNLSAASINAVCERVKRSQADQVLCKASIERENNHQEPNTHLQHLLWQACLDQARPTLGKLAQRIQSVVSWDDLILPEADFQLLKTLAAQVKQRSTVYEEWGFADRRQQGLGITALFAGGSGTGKTLAAETLANELELDLYRIDLSTVVSKYIGETEKHLKRIFDGAEMGGAILLFDEADALFGKRSEVKDARDRYANIEVAYLLQRIEAYRGLAILTTNLKDSLDQAFLRRIRFVVQFPFPDASQREAIWQRSFPPKVPLGELNFRMLAKLKIAGGNIRNIALNAAFLAADTDDAVQMSHIIRAAQSEYIKLERPLTELKAQDLKKWLCEGKGASP